MDIHPIRAHRLSQTPKLSQAGLAQQLDVSRLTVLRWEAGTSKVDEKKVVDVARITGIPAKVLRPDLIERLEQLVGGDQ